MSDNSLFKGRTAYDLIMQDKRKLDEIKMLIQSGHTDNFVARFLNVSVASFKAWIKRYPDFETLVNRWKDHADDNVVKALYDKAIGYNIPEEKVSFDKNGDELRATIVKHVPPDFSAISLWLRNRKREEWKDIKDMSTKAELTVDNGLKIGKPELTERIENLRKDVIATTARPIEPEEVDTELDEMLS